jgi:hypothetical protein
VILPERLAFVGELELDVADFVEEVRIVLLDFHKTQEFLERFFPMALLCVFERLLADVVRLASQGFFLPAPRHRGDFHRTIRCLR